MKEGIEEEEGNVLDDRFPLERMVWKTPAINHA
jgi:hypothetical protein